MADTPDDWDEFETLGSRIITILPQTYHDCYEEIQPVPMGSASIKYAADGQVAWDAMWETFCNLAMAGGPPHKGKLLRPGSATEIHSQPDRFRDVVREICRGITMVTDLVSGESSIPGWVRVECDSDTTAAWLIRAILMENVSAFCERTTLYLPAGPAYQVGKEIKNVITVMAKTCHYWFGHVPTFQQKAVTRLFEKLDAESPLIQPPRLDACDLDRCKELSDKIVEGIHRANGLRSSNEEYVDWVGVECPDVRTAICMMRAVVVGNVVSRREGAKLFVPVNPATDPQGETVVRTVTRALGFAEAQGIL